MAKLVERVAALGQAIGADIKAILAKTNALKTAAYKDVGLAAGNVPQFVGANGLAGFGYGGKAISIPSTADLNTYNTVTADYGGVFKPTNYPESSVFGGYTLSVVVNENITSQTLVTAMYATPKHKLIVYRRIYMSGKWTDWVRVVDPSKVESANYAIPLATADFNNLRFVSGAYAGNKGSVTAGFPSIATTSFISNYILEVIVADDGTGFISNLVQTLTIFAYNQTFDGWITAKLERTLFGSGNWTEWTFIYNNLDGASGGGGDKGVFSSISAGSLSPNMAYAEVSTPLGVIKPSTGGSNSALVSYPSNITPESIIHVQASVKTTGGHTIMPASGSYLNTNPSTWQSYYIMDYDYAPDGALFVYDRATAGKLSNGTACVLITYRTT